MEHLFDTHFHLDLQKNRNTSIHEIEEHGIYTIAVTNLPDLFSKESGEIASKYIRFALGFHPELIHEYKGQIPLMWDLLSSTRYIGEVGLDFVDITHKDEQITFFSELVERCRYDDKIITIHSRKAVREVLDIIGTNFRFKPILHWFTGNKIELVDAIDRGYYFSINLAMLKTKKIQTMLALIPEERILLETDSPFVSSMFSHHEALAITDKCLRIHHKNINPWENFRAILGG